MSRAVRRLLLATIVLALAGLVVTMDRWPTFWPDGQLYASIARARQTTGGGVPSMIRHSPYATDHIVFYGPVFFDLAAAAFDVFGVSKWAFRLVTMAAALLFVAAGALLGRTLGGSRDRALWSATLLLLTPEMFLHARSGSMDMVAVGFEGLALAMYVRGLVSGERPTVHGSAAGCLLALAGLTTPRSYPFVGAFLLAGALAPWLTGARRAAWRLLAATALVFFAIGAAWVASVPGGPRQWAEYMTFVATHEASDVAILPGAQRVWVLAMSSAVTPAFAAAGALAAAWTLGRRKSGASSERVAIAFALLACGITFVTTAGLMNLTMTVATYFALPLFAVVVSLPDWCFRIGPPAARMRALAAAAAVLLICDTTISAVRYVRIAANWRARDPDAVVAFLQVHVPPGADVIGPVGRYFFSVERTGASYFAYRAKSWADWAQWVPVFDPDAARPQPRMRPVVGRFLIWDELEPMPPTYRCATAHPVARYSPPRGNAFFASLGWIARSDDQGFEPFTLYRLDDGCPRGYDPSGSRAIRSQTPSAEGVRPEHHS